MSNNKIEISDLAEESSLVSILPASEFSRFQDISVDVDIVNGSLSDGIIDVDGDLFYLHRQSSKSSMYILRRLGTTLTRQMREALFRRGVDALLNIELQSSLSEGTLPIVREEGGYLTRNEAQAAVDRGVPDFTGSLGVYYREIFLSHPILDR